MSFDVFPDDERVVPAIQAGALSYLLKDVSAAALAEAVKLLIEVGANVEAMTKATKSLFSATRERLVKPSSQNFCGREG